MKSSSNQSLILTASHCGHRTTQWTTGTGTLVGRVTGVNELYDVSLIPAFSAHREWDGSNPEFSLPLDGTAYSFNGDFVCHDGYTSRVVCNIQVTNGDVVNFMVRGPRYGNTFRAIGVIGRQVNGSIAVRGGDSGGLVFAIDGPSTRQVRGLVSASVDGTNGTGIFWTEALDIYAQFGLRLTEQG